MERGNGIDVKGKTAVDCASGCRRSAERKNKNRTGQGEVLQKQHRQQFLIATRRHVDDNPRMCYQGFWTWTYI